MTAFNVDSLRQMVVNGPKVHPGALYVEDEKGVTIDLATRSRSQVKAEPFLFISFKK